MASKDLYIDHLYSLHINLVLKTLRNSRPEVFCEKGFLKNFPIFTGKHLWQSFFFQACNFIKKETLVQVFLCEFCKIFKSTFFHRTPPVAASRHSILWKPFVSTEPSRIFYYQYFINMHLSFTSLIPNWLF